MYQSMGLDPNWHNTCCAPLCAYLRKGPQDGGWCMHHANRVTPSSGWPHGFTPSVASTGGCDKHSALTPNAPNAPNVCQNCNVPIPAYAEFCEPCLRGDD